MAGWLRVQLLAAAVLLVPAVAVGANDGVSSLPEFLGPFPDGC